MSEIFKRTELLLGKSKLAKLHKGRVAIIGLGAVGSYAVEALARAGVGQLLLVDCDVIDETNINRQLYALHSTIGRDKVELARERVLDINPDCKVEIEKMFAHSYSIGSVFAFQPDMIIDAVDSLNAKVNILAEIYRHKIPVISSMGAAVRKDPTKIRFDDISHTHGCPLASLVRKRLKKIGIHEGIQCVYSTEPVILNEDAEEAEEVEVSQGRKRKVLGSMSTITGIFGLTVAHHTIETLIGGFS
jgi:tRNA A37 threonylcarbamoyladenosine dehydratase